MVFIVCIHWDSLFTMVMKKGEWLSAREVYNRMIKLMKTDRYKCFWDQYEQREHVLLRRIREHLQKNPNIAELHRDRTVKYRYLH